MLVKDIRGEVNIHTAQFINSTPSLYVRVQGSRKKNTNFDKNGLPDQIDYCINHNLHQQML